MNIPNLEDVLETVNNTVDKYFEIRSDETKIFELHDLADELGRCSLYLAYHYRIQEKNFSIANVSYYGNLNSRKRELMTMPSFEGKKMSVAYAMTIASEEFYHLKRDYILAESEKDSIKTIIFQVKDNLESIRQRIASIKNNNV